MVDWVLKDRLSLNECVESKLGILLFVRGISYWRAKFHRLVERFLQKTVFLDLLQNDLEIFLTGLRNLKINHWLVD